MAKMKFPGQGFWNLGHAQQADKHLDKCDLNYYHSHICGLYQ